MCETLRISDMFCGIGSFSLAAMGLGMSCVFACDMNENDSARKIYHKNIGMMPCSNLGPVDPNTVLPHDIMCIKLGHNGKPMSTEPNSPMERVIDILSLVRPRAFIIDSSNEFLESKNVTVYNHFKNLIAAAGYTDKFQFLSCENFGIPQQKKRLFIVGFCNSNLTNTFKFPVATRTCPTLSEYLEMEFENKLAVAVRSSGRKSGISSQKNWSAYRLLNGQVIELEIKHVMKLQGLPPDLAWANITEAQKWQILGATTPLCLCQAILHAVAMHLLNAQDKHENITSMEIENDVNCSVASSSPPSSSSPILSIPSPSPPRAVTFNKRPAESVPRSRIDLKRKRMFDRICVPSGTKILIELPESLKHHTFTLEIYDPSKYVDTI